MNSGASIAGSAAGSSAGASVGSSAAGSSIGSSAAGSSIGSSAGAGAQFVTIKLIMSTITSKLVNLAFIVHPP
jgi:hypothetical protein